MLRVNRLAKNAAKFDRSAYVTLRDHKQRYYYAGIDVHLSVVCYFAIHFKNITILNYKDIYDK